MHWNTKIKAIVWANWTKFIFPLRTSGWWTFALINDDVPFRLERPQLLGDRASSRHPSQSAVVLMGIRRIHPPFCEEAFRSPSIRPVRLMCKQLWALAALTSRICSMPRKTVSTRDGKAPRSGFRNFCKMKRKYSSAVILDVHAHLQRA